jgi:serine/threonine protein kinase
MKGKIVKIVDFGVSAIFNNFDDGFVSGTVGTWPFWSPEIFEKNVSHNDNDNNEYKYDAYKADVWAAGVILWILMFGSLPFNGCTYADFLKCSCGDLPEFPKVKSAEVMNLLKSMLIKSPTERPSFQDCESFLWVQEYSNETIELELSKMSVLMDRSNLDTGNVLTLASTIYLSATARLVLKRKMHALRIRIAERLENRKKEEEFSSKSRRHVYHRQSEVSMMLINSLPDDTTIQKAISTDDKLATCTVDENINENKELLPNSNKNIFCCCNIM